MTQTILLTGGCGYIGSHTAVLLLQEGYDVVLYDNLANSKADVVPIINQLSNRQAVFIEGDICDTQKLQSTLQSHNVTAVIHFAGLKSVAESVANPAEYHRVNVGGSISVMQAMQAAQCDCLLYSSSASIYGEVQGDGAPIDEYSTPSPANPYGNSKWLVEQMMRDIATDNMRLCALRYFNPLGAHASGRIGDNPLGKPNNLLPVLMDAVSSGTALQIFGDDYPTRDGTCIRDYIHIADLVEGHLAALRFLQNNTGYHCFNLGTQSGYTVKEIISAFEKVNGVKVPHKIAARRAGDVSVLLASVKRAEKHLGWRAQQDLSDMLKTAWNWHNHPRP